MKTRDFSFELPRELIAQHPSDRREEARLLVVDRRTGGLEHSQVHGLPMYVEPGTVVVLNDSKVRKARLYGLPTGGDSPVEFLLVAPYEDGAIWNAVVRRAKRQHLGRVYRFPGGVTGVVTGADGALREVHFDRPVTDTYLEEHGAVPLPPYIKRDVEEMDEERYQTVYARQYGSVAAPTAGLHLTRALLDELETNGVHVCTVTLHVGLGTFTPVRSERVEDHDMHSEEYEVSEETAETIRSAKAEGRPVLAVGTTSVRTLESAARPDPKIIEAGRRTTDIFIHPPYDFRIVDRMLTNFHTPESTLLMLVAAFAGLDLVKKAYTEAVARRYRFFSYGDATLFL